MKNKKKLLVLALALVLLIVAAVSATLAYFTDTEGVKNTMTVGNVSIEQLEHKRDGSTAYEDKLDLYPAVYDKAGPSYDGKATLANGETKVIFDESVSGEIDKFISIENTGNRPAYVRTILLFEHPSPEVCNKVHTYSDMSDGQVLKGVTDGDGAEAIVEIDGTKYCIVVATYNTALQPGQVSAPSLCQIYLDPTATNEWSEAVGGDYTIIAFSQATQTMGFEEYKYTAGQALDASFGEVTADNVAAWINGLNLGA